MATSIKALLDQTLLKLGVLASGNQADPTEYADGLASLRQMLDAWSLEDLLIPFSPTETFALDPDRNFYSMGVGGDWDTVRPERVEIIRVIEAGRSYPLVESSLEKRSYQSELQRGNPTSYVVTRDARFVYVELDSFPSSGMALVTSLKPFNVSALDNFDAPYDPDAEPETALPSGFTLTGIQTAIDFPSGYEQALVYNLAIHIAPEYGREAPQTVIAVAGNTKRMIKRRNWRPLLARPEAMWRSGPRRGTYDVQSGP